MRGLGDPAPTGRQPPLDWPEPLTEETLDIVMAAYGHHAFLLA
jgi:hypothetical protein